VGSFIAAILCGATSDWYMEKASAGGEKKPEYRLPPMVLGALVIPAGMLIYGWTAHFHLHWVIPLVGTALVGFGIVSSIIPSMAYLIDSFPLHSASAISVMDVMLALSGTLFPLAAPPLYSNLGLGWGNSLLAFIALAFAPLPWVLMKYGEQIRKRGAQIKL
jgi:MFS family permease